MNPDDMVRDLMKGNSSLIHIEIADTFWKRAIGLIGKPRMEAGRGLLIPDCRSIHTGFMRFPLDLVFLDRNGRVVNIVRNVRPWRVVWGGGQARSVLEVQSGWLPEPAGGDEASPPPS